MKEQLSRMFLRIIKATQTSSAPEGVCRELAVVVEDIFNDKEVVSKKEFEERLKYLAECYEYGAREMKKAA